jgi:hypothetical protein
MDPGESGAHVGGGWPMTWQRIDESEMMRAWSLAEATGPSSPMQQVPQLDPMREKKVLEKTGAGGGS